MPKISHEKRSFKRYPVRLNVGLRTEPDGSYTEGDFVENVSVGGMKLATETGVNEGGMLYCNIRLSDADNIETIGKVVWTRRDRHHTNKERELGIKFISIKPVDKFRLLQYAYQQWLEGTVKD